MRYESTESPEEVANRKEAHDSASELSKLAYELIRHLEDGKPAPEGYSPEEIELFKKGDIESWNRLILTVPYLSAKETVREFIIKKFPEKAHQVTRAQGAVYPW